MNKWLLATCLTAMGSQVMADTVVHVRSGEGAAEKVSIHGDKVRMDGLSGDKEYMIGDLASGVVYVVMPGEKTILELKSNGKSARNNAINAELKKVGAGPAMAGFSTTEYQLLADGQTCGSIWISSEAGEISDVKRLLQVMDQFDPESMMPEGMGGMVASQMGTCDRAQLITQSQIAGLGMPMKSLDHNGEVEQEVVSIDRNASLSAELFDLPAGYQRTTPGAMINNAMSQMQEMMKSVTPEQRQMMEQMMQQFGGQMPK